MVPIRLKYLFLSFLLTVISVSSAFSQSGVAQITAADPRHETLDQQVVSVLFNQTIQAVPLPSILGWSVTVNTIPVFITGIAVAGTRVNLSFTAIAAHAGQSFVIPTDVVRVAYNSAIVGSNTLTATPGFPEITTFALALSKNNYVPDCSDFAFFQIGNFAAPDICSPVFNNFRQFQYFVSLRYRNSTVSVATLPKFRIIWEAPAGAQLQLDPLYTDNAGTPNGAFFTTVPGFPASVLTSRDTYTFPDNTNVCSFRTDILPRFRTGAVILNCPTIGQSSTFISYDMDDQNTGILALAPSVANSHRVCLGVNVNTRYSDNTTLNCVPDVPLIGSPNELVRWVRFIYGFQNSPTPQGNIRDLLVGGVGVVNAAGVIAPAGGYFPTGAGGVGVPDFQGVIQLATPVNLPTAISQTRVITTSTFANHVTGQRFYVRMQYWNTCNPYNGVSTANAVQTDNVNTNHYIEIITRPNPPTATPSPPTFCENQADANYLLTASGAGGTFKWYRVLGPPLSDLDQTANTFNPITDGQVSPVISKTPASTTTDNYFLTETNGTNCESLPATIPFTVLKNVTGGTITHPGPNPICTGTTPAAFGSSLLPTGGTGVYAYQWESSPSGCAAFANIAGAIGVTYTPGAGIAATTCYRRRATSGTISGAGTCTTAVSNTITITVHTAVTGGTIAANHTVCETPGNPNLLTSSVNGGGGDGTQSYQWQSSTVGGGVGFGNIAGATASTYDPPAGLTVTTFYRRRNTSGVCVPLFALSNEVQVTVHEDVLPGTISAAQTICSGQTPAGLTGTVASQGNGVSWTYQWEQSTTSPGVAGFANIGGATAVNFAPGALTQTTWYRRLATSGQCPAQYTNTIQITVNALPTVASATGGGAVCGLNPAPDIVFTFTGTTDFDFTVNVNPGADIIVNNHNSTTYTIVGPMPGVATSYNISVLSDGNGCAATVLGGTVNVTVGGFPPVFDSAPVLAANAACLNGGATTDPSLTFSLDPASTSAGDYTLTYRVDGTLKPTKIFTVVSPGNGNTTAPITFNDAEFNTTLPSPHVLRVVSILTPAGCQSVFNQDLNFTVHPIPIGSNQTVPAVCAPAALNLNPQTIGIDPVPGNALPSTFAWTAAYPGGLTGGLANGTGNITGFTLANVSGGQLSAVFTVTPTSITGLCPGATFTITAPINPLPVLNAGQTATVCGGTALGYHILSTPANLPAGTLFNWPDPDGGGPATAGVNVAIGGGATVHINDILTNVSGAATTTTYVVTPTSSAGCIGASQNVVVTVNPLPVLVNPQSKAICSGSAVAYHIQTVPLDLPLGTVLNWPDPDAGGPATAGVNVPIASALHINDVLTNTTGSPTTVNYVVTPTSGTCVGTARTIAITVNAAPALVVGQAKTICSGQAADYRILLAPNNLPVGTLFSWPIPNMSAGGGQGTARANVPMTDALHITDVLTNILAVPITATYTITPTSGIPCGGTPQTVVITINPLPVPNPIQGPATVCESAPPGSVVFFQVTQNGANTYSWTVPAGFTVAGGGGGAVPGGGPGPFSADYFILLKFLTGAPSGTLSVVEKNSPYNCNGATNSLPITVVAAPGAVVFQSDPGPSTVFCKNQQLVKFMIVGPNPTSSYTWSLPIGGATFNGPSGGPVIFLDFGANPGVTIQVVETNVTGCPGTPGTLNVSLSDQPVMMAPFAATICSGQAPSAAPLTLTASAASTFDWEVTAVSAGITGVLLGQTGTGQLNMPLTNISGVAGSVTFEVIPTLSAPPSCVGNAQAYTINVNPEPVVTAVANQFACATSAVNIPLSSNVGGATINWTYAGAAIGVAASGSGNINFAAVDNLTGVDLTGTFTVTATANSCTSAGANAKTFNINIRPRPEITSALPNLTSCPGDIVGPINFVGDAGAETFNWTNSNTAIGLVASGAGDIGAFFSPTNATGVDRVGTIIVIATKNGCVGPSRTFTITNKHTPILSSTLTPPAVCSTTTFNYAATSASGGATFAWTRAAVVGISEAASGGAGNVSEVLTNTTTSPIIVTYAFITTVNSCSNSPQNVVVTVNPTPTLSSTLSPAAICSNATFSYAPTSATAGATFAWSRAAVAGISQGATGGISGVSELLTNTTTAPVNVTYAYITTANGCSNTPQNVVVTVNPIPVLNSSLSPPAICSGTVFNYTPTSATVGATFAWSRAAVAGISQGASSATGNVSETLTNTTTSPVNVTYAFTTTANGCSNTPQNVVVTVNPTPVLTSSLTPPAICSTTTFNYAPTSATGGATFAWSRALVAGISQAASGGAGNVSETLTNTTTAPVSVTYAFITTANTCSSPVQNVVVIVNPIPVLSSTLTPAAICSGATFNYAPTSATAGATFAWSRAVVAGISQGASGGIAGVSETLTNTTTAPIIVTYVYVTTANTCNNAPGQNVVVTVNPIPVLSSTLTPAAICSGTTFSYAATSATAGATFAWSRAFVAGISEAAIGGTGNVSETLTNTTTAPINVTYAYTTSANGCSNTPQNVVVTVNPIPVLSSTLTPAAICSATIFSYTATSATAGATFAWTRAVVAGISQGASGGAGNVSETLTNTTTAPINVTYVFVTTANACNNAPGQNVVVTVNPIPVLSSTLTPAAICSGVTFSYTATSATAGATFAWSRAVVGGISQGASGGAGNVSEILTNTTTAPVNVTYVYTTTANGCSNTPQNVVVTVNPIPVLSSTLTPAAICSGTTFNYIATSATAGATFAWTRALVAGITEAATGGAGNVSETLTNTTASPINVTYAYVTSANGCSNAPQNVIVTVNPIPVLSSTLTPPAICSGATFTYTATSATGGATFAWSRAVVAGISQGAGAGAGNVSEMLTNTTTAPVNVTYIYISTANSCNNAPGQNVVVTVNPIPVLSSTLTPPAICSGSIFSYTPTSATAGSTFAWSRAAVGGISQGASTGTAAVNETLTNTTTAPINVTYVYITTANGCSSAPQNVVVIVNPIPALNSTLTPPAICSATTFGYTPTSPTAGATFAWSRALVAGISEAASGGAGSVSEVLTNTTTAPVNVIYAYTTTANGCSNTPQNVVVIVNPTPVLSSTLTPAAICSGATFNYTATSATAGATFAWTRALVAGISQAAAGGAGSVSEILTNTTTAPIIVTYVYVTTANSCNNTPGQNVVVTVNPIPVLSSTLTPPAICSATTFNYIPTSATAGATFAWSRAFVAGISEAAIGGAGNVSEVLTNTTTAPIVVTYAFTTTANGCSNTPQNVVVTVYPTPSLSSTLTPPAICSGTIFSYTPTSATAGSTFAWSRALVAGISEAASSGAGNVIETLTNTTTAPINVTYVFTTTANGCSNTPQNVVVVVNPIPVLSSTLTPPAICSGTTFSYTPTSATVGATFAWSRALVAGISQAAAAGAGNVSEVLTNTTTAPIVVTYAYTTTANSCSNAPQNVVVTVNPIPVLSSTLSPPAICSATTFSYTPTSATAGATFAWTRALVAGISEAAAGGAGNVSETLTNTTTAPIVVTYVYVTTANGCSNAPQNVVVTVNPTPVLSSTLTPPAICSATTFSYTPTSATAGTTFTWSRAIVAGISQGAGAGAGSVSETLTNTTTAPIIVTYVFISTANTCNNSPGQNVVVTVNPIPVLSSTLTPPAICSGIVFSYTPTSATAGATFAWGRAFIAGISEAAAGGTGSVNEVLTNTTTAPINVTYSYTTTANGCSNAPQSVVVTVNPIPVLSSTLTPPAICSATTFNYAPTSATAGATFAWSRAAVAGISEGATGGAGLVSEVLTNVTTAPINVTYAYITTANGCSNTPQNVVVIVNPIPALSSTLTPAAICSATTFSYTPTSATAGATFAWTRAFVAGISQAATGGTGSVSEILTNTTTGPLNVTYAYTTTANACSNTPQNVVVTVNPIPVLSSTLTPPAICSGGTFSYTATSATGGSTFAWSRAAVAGITEAASSSTGNVSEILTNTTASPINVTYVYITTANGCNSPAQNVVVAVNPTPALSSTLTPPAICSGTAFTYTATSATGGATFAWSRALVAGISEAASSGAGNVSEVLTNTTTAPINVTYSYITTANGCSNTPQNVVVIVNPIPVLSSTLAPPAICSGTIFSYTATSATAGATFAWSRAAVAGIAQGAASSTGNVSETLTNNTTAPINVTYAYITSANGCSNTAQNVIVIVNPIPVLNSTLSPPAICSATTFTYTATSATAGATFAWTRALVAGISEAASGGAGNVSEVLTNTTTAPINVTYVYVTTANGCSNTPQNIVVTVNPIPVLSSTLAPPAICSGIVFSYTATSATAGATFAWSRAVVAGISQAAAGSTGNVSETLTNTTTAPIPVTYVYITTANGCSSTPQNVVVIVNPIPVLSSTLTPPAICSGSIFTYTATSATAGATFAWSRAAVGGISQGAVSSTGNVSETLTNITAAPINVTYVYVTTANGCSNLPQNVVVIVNPTPVLSSTLAPPPICSGLTFSYAPTSATAGATFAWSRAAVAGISEAASSGAANVSETLTNTTTAPVTVTYVYITTANACSSPPQNVVVTVNPIPILSSTLTPPAICSGATFNYTATSGTAGAAFAWNRAFIAGITEAASSGNGNVSEILTNTTTAPISVIYSYVTSANGCSSLPQNVAVMVNPIPVLSSTLTPPAICSGATFAYTATSATVGATFAWSRAFVPGISEGPSIGTGNVSEVLTNLTATPINVTYIYVTTANGCTNTPQNVGVMVSPIPTLSSTLTPAAICSATIFNYIPTSATAGATFAWSRALVAGISQAASGGAGNVSEMLTNTTTASIVVTYAYTTTANGCSNTPQNVVVTVHPTPVLTSTLAPPAICSGTTFVYTATSATVGATFSWNRPGVAGISQGASSGSGNVSEMLTNTTTVPVNVTYEYITTANGCSNTPAQNVVVVVNPDPVVTPVTSIVVCSEAPVGPVAFASNVDPGAVFNWTNDNPAVGLAGAGSGTISFTAVTNTGSVPIVANISVTATKNSCTGAVRVFTITINPEPVLSVPPPAAICSRDITNIILGTNGISVIAGSYRLTQIEYSNGGPFSTTPPANFTFPPTNRTVASIGFNDHVKNDVFNNTSLLSVVVRYTIVPVSPPTAQTPAGCDGDPVAVDITVNPEPALDPALSPTSICSGIAIDPTNTTFELRSAVTSVASTSFILRGVSAPGLTAGPLNETTGPGKSKDAIDDDSWINTTGGQLSATYTIAPVAGVCVGPDQTVVVLVDPSPAVKSGLDRIVCSNTVSGIVLQDNSPTSAPAVSWDVIGVAVVPPVPGPNVPITPGSTVLGLTANAANAPTGISASVNIINGDRYINTTDDRIVVVYTIVPVGGVPTNCRGPQGTVTLTVEPPIRSVSTLAVSDICSATPISIILGSPTYANGNPTNPVVTFSYNIVPAAGISGNTVGNNLAEGTDITDALVNTTNNAITVNYRITPKASAAANSLGCTGSFEDVFVVVQPKPKLTIPGFKTICEGTGVGIALNSPTIGTSPVSFDYTAAIDAPGVVGDITGFTTPGNFANNTTLNDVLGNTQISNRSVTYTLTPSFVNGLATCTGDAVATQITVSPRPVINALTNFEICSGSVFAPVTVTYDTDPSTTIVNWTVVPDASITGEAGGAGDQFSAVLFNNSNDSRTLTYTFIATNAANSPTCPGGPQTLLITVYPIPTITGVPSSKDVCFGALVSIPLASNKLNTEYRWSVDNGGDVDLPPIPNGSASGATPAINQTFINNGTDLKSYQYTIIPFVTVPSTSEQCDGIDKTMMVNVAPQLTADMANALGGNEIYLCTGSKDFIYFTFSGHPNFDYTYTEAGVTKTVNNKGYVDLLQVQPAVTTTYVLESAKDGFDCVTNFNQTVTVFVDQPDANFSVVQAPIQCSPFPYDFQYNRRADATYVWKWGDGDEETYFSSTTTPGDLRQHLFTNPSPSSTPKFKVTLETYLDPLLYQAGCLKRSTQEVRLHPKINAQVFADKDVICSDEQVIFVNSSQGATIHKWYYRAQSTTAQNDIRTTSVPLNYRLPNTTASNPLVIEVVYEANNAAGCPAAPVVVPITVYRGIDAGFTHGPLPKFVGGHALVDFTNTSVPIDATEFRYEWDFGIMAVPQNVVGTTPPTIDYTRPGVKEVVLIATNMIAEAQGLTCLSEHREILEILRDPIIASFVAIPLEACFPTDITITENTSTADVYAWRVMDFSGIAATSNATLPVFSIPRPGQYTVELTATDSFTGEQKTALQDVTIYNLPMASFDARPGVVFVPDGELNTFNFSEGATEYEWDFGDGTVLFEEEPKHTYKVEGIYDIMLIAKNDHGNGVVCVDTLTRKVTAKQGGVTRVPNAFTPSGNGATTSVNDPNNPNGGNGTAGNGFNDVFLPQVKGAEEFNMQIFDRWGNLIFESNNANTGWDGYDRNGRFMPAGVYVYKLTLRLSDGQRSTQVGDITMIR